MIAALHGFAPVFGLFGCLAGFFTTLRRRNWHAAFFLGLLNAVGAMAMALVAK